MRPSLIASLAAASLFVATPAEAAVTRSADVIPRHQPAQRCGVLGCASKLTPAQQQQLTGIVNDFQSQANQLSQEIKSLQDQVNALRSQIKAAKRNKTLRDSLTKQKNALRKEYSAKAKLMKKIHVNAAEKLGVLNKEVTRGVKAGVTTKVDVQAMKDVIRNFDKTAKAALSGTALTSSSISLTNGLLLTVGVVGATGAILTSISPS